MQDDEAIRAALLSENEEIVTAICARLDELRAEEKQARTDGKKALAARLLALQYELFELAYWIRGRMRPPKNKIETAYDK